MFFKTNSFSWDKVFFRFLDRLKRWNHLFASRVCVEAYREYLHIKLHDETNWKPSNNHLPYFLFFILSQIIVRQTISRFPSIHAIISYSWRCEMRQTTPQSASFYPMICVISCDKMRQIIVCFAVFYTMTCHKPFYVLLSTTLTSLINPFVVTNILICNAVSVVPLIAQGWRGTSLPRVNVHKEIQRHRCWAFSIKTRL